VYKVRCLTRCCAVVIVTNPLVALATEVPRFQGVVAANHDVVTMATDRLDPRSLRQYQLRTANHCTQTDVILTSYMTQSQLTPCSPMLEHNYAYMLNSIRYRIPQIRIYSSKIE